MNGWVKRFLRWLLEDVIWDIVNECEGCPLQSGRGDPD